MNNREEKDSNAGMKFGVPHNCVAKKRGAPTAPSTKGFRWASEVGWEKNDKPHAVRGKAGAYDGVHLQVYIFSDRLAVAC